MANSPFYKICYAILSWKEIKEIGTHIKDLYHQYDENDKFVDYKTELLRVMFSANSLIAHNKFLTDKCESKVNN